MPGQDLEGRLVDRDRIEQRRLVLLQVALVRQRQALEHREGPGQRPDDARRAAADELGRIRVLLVRHHAAAGRERVRGPDEAERRVRPPGQLLGEPAEVDHPEGDRPERLDDEVPVRDGIERVRRDAIEVEFAGRGLAVERVAGTGQRTRPERADVGPAASVGQASPVALDHLDVGQEVMGEQHRLGGLDVGRPRQDDVALALGQLDERPLEDEDGRVEAIDRAGASRAAGPSRPGRSATGRCGACPRRVRSGPPARPRGSCGRPRGTDPSRCGRRRRPRPARSRPPTSSSTSSSGQQPGPPEAADVGDRGRQVVGGEPGIHLDRAGEIGDPLIVLLAEAAAPESHACLRMVDAHGTRRAEGRATAHCRRARRDVAGDRTRAPIRGPVGRARDGPVGRPWRGPRPARSERGRQDHDGPDAHRAHRPERRHGVGRGLRRPRPAGRGAEPDRHPDRDTRACTTSSRRGTTWSSSAACTTWTRPRGPSRSNATCGSSRCGSGGTTSPATSARA